MSLEKTLESWSETASADWRPVTGAAVIGLALLVGYIVWQHYFTPDRWVFLLDNTNLAIHEAGHPIVGVLVPGWAVYGGTLFQLLFPAMFAGHFWRQRHGLGWSVALVWFGESLLNVGRYMADARAHELPLVGGGDHDWTEIFNRWGVLSGDTGIAGATRLIGLCVMLYALFWLWKRWRSARVPSTARLIRRSGGGRS
ncbi:hypothetical protein SAMN04244573_00911 [Azotobacter beijerinckii]|uniref:Uncharacterized protein n=1 Tax=Azotobacter beijerinckii TaxID=170623 RepID=A0A1H9CXK5_9GAMM|nr:hypothetical protein [Azotobacter beijerinckii]SEQ05940.1 hypothetical protein SAMN04244573_00911 [Azotobacter beijerinckii]